MPLDGYDSAGRGGGGASVKITVRVPATLTTSLGTITCVSEQGALTTALTLADNAIVFEFGSPYSTSNTTNWKWTPGYVTPGSPGLFTPIGSGRQNNIAGGAVGKWSSETYTHASVTIPVGSIPAVQCTPTNYPSPADSTYHDHLVIFGTA